MFSIIIKESILIKHKFFLKELKNILLMELSFNVVILIICGKMKIQNFLSKK